MSEWSSLHGIRLWRPLLDKTRNELRKSLRERKTKWTDDPTNEDPNYERVRIRTALARNEGKLPSPNDIARLAKLSAKSKRWLNEHVARCLKSDVAHDFDGTLVFSPTDDCPYPVVLETLAFLILVAGGLAFRIPTSKITEFVNQARTNRRGTTTVGRCLIKSHQGQITVQRESRNLPDLPEFVDRAMIYDGRQLLQPSQTGKSPKTTPYIHALESFRPAIDDPVYAALMEVLNSPR